MPGMIFAGLVQFVLLPFLAPVDYYIYFSVDTFCADQYVRVSCVRVCGSHLTAG